MYQVNLTRPLFNDARILVGGLHSRGYRFRTGRTPRPTVDRPALPATRGMWPARSIHQRRGAARGIRLGVGLNLESEPRGRGLVLGQAAWRRQQARTST